MVYESLSIIREELGVYIEQLNDGGVRSDVILGNISLIDTPDGDGLRERIVVSLVNIEEESVLKNIPNREYVNGNLNYKNPIVNLNLYLLFSANWPESYDNALIRLSNVIRFFQGKKIFTIQNSPAGAGIIDTNDEDIQALRLNLDLYTMTFEQLNHLWGALGGKQIPSVLYKMRLTPVEDKRILEGGSLITEIETKTS